MRPVVNVSLASPAVILARGVGLNGVNRALPRYVLGPGSGKSGPREKQKQ